jgi:hypothetical protein
MSEQRAKRVEENPKGKALPVQDGNTATWLALLGNNGQRRCRRDSALSFSERAGRFMNAT